MSTAIAGKKLSTSPRSRTTANARDNQSVILIVAPRQSNSRLTQISLALTSGRDNHPLAATAETAILIVAVFPSRLSRYRKTFLRNHADGIAAIDLFVVPTISFRLLYGLLIMGHGRRQVIWFGVTTHPTAEWIANQLTEACGWEQLPRYLIRDRDAAYGEVFIRRIRSMGIRDQPT